MTYSIKEVAEKTNLSIYTLRFYDKQGLLPFVSRNASGYRTFTEGDLHLLKTICCLKETGMKIADIDPRQQERKNCFTISDKARCIAGSVLELVCAYAMKQ